MQSFSLAKAPVLWLGAFFAALVVLASLHQPAVAKAWAHASGDLERRAAAQGTDTDRDGLTNRTEVKRTRTNPQKADSDGDGLSDGAEVKQTRTNPRKADSDGDGVSDGAEIFAGSDPWNPASVPGPPRENPDPPDSPIPPADTIPPNTSIVSGPSGSATSTGASFSFSSSEQGSAFTCQLDDSAWAPCNSPKAYAGLTTGPHRFSVRATDAAGNTDLSPATRAWTVEATPPPDAAASAVWEKPANALVDLPVNLDGTSSTGDGPLTCAWTFENKAGTVVFQTRVGCVIEITFESSGMKYVELIVEDADGDAASNKQSFGVDPAPDGEPAPDTVPPDTTIGTGPSGTTTATSASFSFSSTESNSSFQCQLDGLAWAPCVSPQGYSGLALGSHSFAVRAVDSAGNTDPTPATLSWTVEAPTPPPSDTTPPDTTIATGPPAGTTATSASFTFASTEAGSSFECKLDGGVFASCTSPRSYSGLSVGAHTLAVRATDAAGNPDPSPASWTWSVQAPDPPPPPKGSCVAGATNVTSAAAVTTEVSAGRSVCVTADIGNVDLNGMGNSAGVVVSTDGGSMGELEINGTTDLTVRSARFRSVTIRGGHRTVIEDSTIGGTPSNRVLDQLIFMPDTSNDVTIRNNDIGWTRADNSGNTGYGCRCYGTLNRLQFVGNKLHDLAADGFQGVGGSDVLIDRNEIGPVGANPGSSEHSDNIQITGNGPNLRITNNWIHHQGYYEGQTTGNAGSTYIHGGTSNSLVYENNLIETAQGRTEICGLGTGGTSRSNITIRNNTWVDGGRAFSGFPGFEWDCDSGTGNAIERNIAVDPDGGFAQSGSAGAATFAGNVWGQPSLVTIDAQGNCTSANCNPGGAPIGYRKPPGVHW